MNVEKSFVKVVSINHNRDHFFTKNDGQIKLFCRHKENQIVEDIEKGIVKDIKIFQDSLLISTNVLNFEIKFEDIINKKEKNIEELEKNLKNYMKGIIMDIGYLNIENETENENENENEEQIELKEIKENNENKKRKNEFNENNEIEEIKEVKKNKKQKKNLFLTDGEEIFSQNFLMKNFKIYDPNFYKFTKKFDLKKGYPKTNENNILEIFLKLIDPILNYILPIINNNLRKKLEKSTKNKQNKYRYSCLDKKELIRWIIMKDQFIVTTRRNNNLKKTYKLIDKKILSYERFSNISNQTFFSIDELKEITSIFNKVFLSNWNVGGSICLDETISLFNSVSHKNLKIKKNDLKNVKEQKCILVFKKKKIDEIENEREEIEINNDENEEIEINNEKIEIEDNCFENEIIEINESEKNIEENKTQIIENNENKSKERIENLKTEDLCFLHYLAPIRYFPSKPKKKGFLFYNCSEKGLKTNRSYVLYIIPQFYKNDPPLPQEVLKELVYKQIFKEPYHITTDSAFTITSIYNYIKDKNIFITSSLHKQKNFPFLFPIIFNNFNKKKTFKCIFNELFTISIKCDKSKKQNKQFKFHKCISNLFMVKSNCEEINEKKSELNNEKEIEKNSNLNNYSINEKKKKKIQITTTLTEDSSDEENSNEKNENKEIENEKNKNKEIIDLNENNENKKKKNIESTTLTEENLREDKNNKNNNINNNNNNNNNIEKISIIENKNENNINDILNRISVIEKKLNIKNKNTEESLSSLLERIKNVEKKIEIAPSLKNKDVIDAEFNIENKIINNSIRVNVLKEMSKKLNLCYKFDKKKLIHNIKLVFSKFVDDIKKKKEIINNVTNSIYSISNPMHQIYRNTFNSLDLFDKYFYKINYNFAIKNNWTL
jgi:hypothetical protein